LVKGSIRRTTVDFDADLFKRLKEYAIRHDKTMREVITEAVIEKLAREGVEDVKAEAFDDVVETLERYISRSIAERVVERVCQDLGKDHTSLKYEDIDSDFARRIEKYLEPLLTKKALQKVKNEISRKYGGGMR